MSSSPPTPNDLTRQQLDELDALLQRMLSLPLSSSTDLPAVDSAPPPPMPVSTANTGYWRTHVASPRTDGPHLLQESPAKNLSLVTTAVEAPVLKSVSPADAPEQRRSPVAGTEPPESPRTLRGVDAPAVPLGFFLPLLEQNKSMAEREEETSKVELKLVPAPVDLPNETIPTAAQSTDSIPLLTWPVYAVNWVLELLLRNIEPLGSALIQPLSKNILAGVGGILLVASGIWSARGMGWIHFPLPW